MKETKIGYVRVSSREQNEDRQIIAMREAGVPEKKNLHGQAVGEGF